MIALVRSGPTGPNAASRTGHSMIALVRSGPTGPNAASRTGHPVIALVRSGPAPTTPPAGPVTR